MFNYCLTTNINFGKGCLRGLTDAVGSKSAKNVLIFTGAKSAKASGALREVKNRLPFCDLVIFDSLKPNPSIESLAEGVEACCQNNIDLIIAIGGGSVIDYAKAVSVLSKNKGKVENFFYKKQRLNQAKITFIAVPTTFGTSSEITPYSVMTDEAEKTKLTLTDKSLFADFAFIDPQFTLTMPRPLIAAGCADLFSHAVEAYWSLRANELTDSYAALAIRLFLECYQKTYQMPKNLKIRERICLASLYAGLAFSNTRTTACHSISYPMTTVFNIDHGLACILTLAELLEFNLTADRDKIIKLCNLMGCKEIKEAKRKIRSVLSNLKIKPRLRDYGLSKKDLKAILDKGFTPERMCNNPRRMTKQALKRILDNIY